MSDAHDHDHLDALPVEACDWGASPFWHPDEQALYWLDVVGQSVRRYQPASGASDRWDLPEPPGACAPALGGGLVVAMGNAFWRLDPTRLSLDRMASAGFAASSERFTQGRCDALGRFWAGTSPTPSPANSVAPQSAEGSAPHQGGLYRLDTRGQVQRMASGAVAASGLAFSPSQHTLYWGDGHAHTVWAYDVGHSLRDDLSSANAQLTQRRAVKRFAAPPAQWQAGTPEALAYAGRPGGMAVDAQGGLWVAMRQGSQILRLSPEGKLLRRISLPVSLPTMPCFGGPKLKTLYLTTARHTLSAQDRAREPLAGLVLAIEVDTPGLPVNFCGA